MAHRPQKIFAQGPGNPAGNKTDWARLGIDAAKGGYYENAIDLFATAISHDRRNAGLRYNLAIAFQRNGDIDDAAVSLTEALHLKPGMAEAAHRLASIIASYQIEEPGRLVASGLFNALSIPDVATEPLGKMAFTLLKTAGPLGDALAACELDGADQQALAMLERRTAPLLRDPLFLRALTAHTNQDVAVEIFLTSLRRVMFNLPAERFTDRTVLAFAIALAKQCLMNEHVFALRQGEQEQVAALLDRASPKAKPSAADIKDVVVSLMYAQPEDLFGIAPDQKLLQTIRPKPLRSFLLPMANRLSREAGIAKTLPGMGTFADETSQTVAHQYESRPYPRWTTLQSPPEGSFSRMLERFITPARLNFMSQPFRVLVAGCGTGRHAIQSARGYGANAQVTAIDISRRSLCYAAREAEERHIKNIAFAHADLLDPNALDSFYDVIECIGVLHHLADPLKGLRALHSHLRPGGIMQIALYSAVSREELSELRSEPGFPGATCSESEARSYREVLRDRIEDTTGGELTNSPDFWSLSGFRDLVLHVSEKQFTLPEISDALDDLGLVFRGFTLHRQTIDEFHAAYPSDPLPGSLANWWAYEQENPRLFDGMYSFWVEKPDPST